MKRNKSFIILLIALLSVLFSAQAQYADSARKEINIPDIPGYKTLKCDFHTHTVFSDGNVWPTVRVEEAWLGGLDALALTDHFEYTPHKEDITINYNRPYEIALPSAKSRGITLIKGGEITRKMPPGHLNAIFLKDAAPLKTDKWEDAIQIAHDQGAFIFWNHPGWKGQQEDGVARWYPEHEDLVNKKLINGIEVVNSVEYYPTVHKWCLERNVAMLGNSDTHNPITMEYDSEKGEHRPVTFVFAKDNSEDSIKEALFACRTVVYKDNLLIGKPEYLLAIFENSIFIKNTDIVIKGRERVNLQIYNGSDINYELTLLKKSDDLVVPEKITLYANRTALFNIRPAAKTAQNKDSSDKKSAEQNLPSGKKEIELSYKAENLYGTPGEGMPVSIKFTVDFQKKE